MSNADAAANQQNGALPPAFVHFRDLVRIHLKQILTLDRKPPMQAATLLMMVACEALSTLFGRSRENDIFADLLNRRRVPNLVGRTLFDALRNGLAHDYRPHRIVVGREEVRPILVWKGAESVHLKLVGIRLEGRHLRVVPVSENEEASPRLCVVVEEIWKDLSTLFRELESALLADHELAAAVQARALALLHADENKCHPAGPALHEWRGYVARERWEGASE